MFSFALPRGGRSRDHTDHRSFQSGTEQSQSHQKEATGQKRYLYMFVCPFVASLGLELGVASLLGRLCEVQTVVIKYLCWIRNGPIRHQFLNVIPAGRPLPSRDIHAKAVPKETKSTLSLSINVSDIYVNSFGCQ